METLDTSNPPPHPHKKYTETRKTQPIQEIHPKNLAWIPKITIFSNPSLWVSSVFSSGVLTYIVLESFLNDLFSIPLPKNGSTTHSWALVWRYDQKSLLPSLFVPSVHWQHPPEARIWTNSSTVETRRGLMDKLHRFSCGLQLMVQKSQTTSWDIWNSVNNGIFIYIYLPYQLVQNFWTINSIKRNSRVRLDCQDDLSTTRCLDGSCSGFPRHCSLFKTTEVKRGSVV